MDEYGTKDLPADQRTDEDIDDFAVVLKQALATANPTDQDQDQDWATFAASYLGFCPRQAYLIHLGLRDASEVETDGTTAVASDTTHVPETMRDHQVWVV